MEEESGGYFRAVKLRRIAKGGKFFQNLPPVYMKTRGTHTQHQLTFSKVKGITGDELHGLEEASREASKQAVFSKHTLHLLRFTSFRYSVKLFAKADGARTYERMPYEKCAASG